jgi:hypothetical protein
VAAETERHQRACGVERNHQEAPLGRRSSMAKMLCKNKKLEAHAVARREDFKLRKQRKCRDRARKSLAGMTIVTRRNKIAKRGTVVVVTRIPLRSHKVADSPMVSFSPVKKGPVRSRGIRIRRFSH